MAGGSEASNLVVLAEHKLDFYRLLEALEAPFALLLFQSGEGQELGNGILRVGLLHLLGVVVLVLDVDIPGVLVLVVLVLEVIASIGLVEQSNCWAGSFSLLLVGLLHKVVVIRHGGGSVDRKE